MDDTEESKPGVYSIEFNSKGTEAKLKEIKTKGCNLHVSRSMYDKHGTIYNFTILNKYLDEISPVKIVFSSIGFNCHLGSRFDNVRELTAHLANIPTIVFKYCKITCGFCSISL
jgi:methionine synthase I (cobalamin-dependent)